MKATRVTYAVLGFCALAAACQTLLGIEDTKARVEDASVGSSSGGAGSSSGATAFCPSDPNATATPPPPPPPPGDSDGGLDTDASLVFVIRSYSLQPEPGASSFGFDLDGYDTRPEQGAAARCVTANSIVETDEPGGIDNVAYKLLRGFSVGGSFKLDEIDRAVNGQISAGTSSMVMEIRDYNRDANDPSVLVGVAASAGTTNGEPPSWNGGDTWSYVSNNKLLYRDVGPFVSGYVVNHVLVVESARSGLTWAKLEFPLFGLPIPFTRSRLAARIVLGGEGSGAPDTLSGGLAAGTVSPYVLHDALRRIQAGQPEAGTSLLCTDNDRSLCDLLVRSSDIPGPGFCAGTAAATEPCEDITFTFRFNAEAARLGPAVDPRRPGDGGCPPFDPAARVCPP